MKSLSHLHIIFHFLTFIFCLECFERGFIVVVIFINVHWNIFLGNSKVLEF